MANLQELIVVGKRCYVRLEGRLHQSEILGVENKTVWVKFAGEAYPVEGLGVDLEFHLETGWFSYHTRVIRGASQPGDGLLLERSASVDERRHRRHWRVPTDIMAAVNAPHTKAPTSGRILNLSTGGLMLRSFAKLPLHEDILLRFDLPDFPGMTVRARVVYGEELSSLTNEPNQRYGVEFTHISPEDRRALTYFLWARIRECYPEEVRALYPRNKAHRKKP